MDLARCEDKPRVAIARLTEIVVNFGGLSRPLSPHSFRDTKLGDARSEVCEGCRDYHGFDEPCDSDAALAVALWEDHQ